MRPKVLAVSIAPDHDALTKQTKREGVLPHQFRSRLVDVRSGTATQEQGDEH
jgi:hypothetical protein